MDLQHLRASDGTGEAILAHVQSVRSIGSTVLDLDNIDNWNSKCIVVTGTPAANGYIATAGMTIMYGHITAGDFIIDGFAPGYSDDGNATTEIAIVKMTTSWADTLVDLLENVIQDTGFLKTVALDHFYKPSEITANNFVATGGVVAQTAGLTGSFSDIVFYVAGLRYSATAVANKVYTGSKDTYVDIGIDGVVDYTEVANAAAAPALAANHIRIAKVITSGAAITSVTQTGVDAKGGNFFRPLTPIRTTKILNPVAFDVYRAAAMTSSATIIFDTVVYDLGNNYNTANGRFTAPITGIYHFDAHSGNSLAASTNIYVEARVNGVAKKNGSVHNSPNAPNHSMFSGDFLLNAGDYVEFYLVGGGGSVVSVGQQNTFANGHLVSII